MNTGTGKSAEFDASVGGVKGLLWRRLKGLRDPDRYIRRHGLFVRGAWWRAMHAWRHKEVARRRRLATRLPAPSVINRIDPAVGASISTGEAVTALTAPSVAAAHDYLNSIDLEKAALENAGGKSYLVPLARQYPISPSNAIFKLALHPEIVGTVADYFGYLPILTEVNVWYSPVWDQNTPYIGSQRYHLDNEDVRQAKVFVYLHDIDADHSPTMYIRKDRSSEICSRHYDEMRKDNIRIDERHLAGETVTYPYGPAGSVCMLDTSGCLHAGGRCKKERKLLVFQYLTPCSHVRNRGVHEKFQYLATPGMDEVERAVLNVD